MCIHYDQPVGPNLMGARGAQNLAIRNVDVRGATSNAIGAGGVAAHEVAEAGVDVPTVPSQPGSLWPVLAEARWALLPPLR
jgi:hypothetical protein